MRTLPLALVEKSPYQFTLGLTANQSQGIGIDMELNVGVGFEIIRTNEICR
jgi:hypothetical protein